MRLYLLGVAVGILVACATGHAANGSEYYLINGKKGTKIDAMRSLMGRGTESGAVDRCNPVMLTDKLTLKNVPKK